jgi:tRNA A-37 threonylcarbamoyl transferase component Bud32
MCAASRHSNSAEDRGVIDLVMWVCPGCGCGFDDGRFCPADGCPLVDEDRRDPMLSSYDRGLGWRPSSDLRDDDLVGVTVDDFRIDAVLGRGATGTVYRATQQALARAVALKVLHPPLASDPEMVARFQREARAVARLSHPGVVAVLAVGEVPDGRPYMAMELIAGTTLERLVEDGPLAQDRAIAIATQVAAALARTHAAGVVHRDLKPANVMLVRRPDGGDRAILVDFGIARTFDDEPRLTAGGIALGTPHYMAPEQVLGEAVDGRTDVYALGVVLYRMVTGAVPFDGAGMQVMMAHLHRVAAEPHLARPDLDPALEAVIIRCLAKRKDDRYQSADDVHGALVRLGAAPAAWAPLPADDEPVGRPRPVRLTTDLFGTAVWQTQRRGGRRGWLAALTVLMALTAGVWAALPRPEAMALAEAIGLDQGLELGPLVSESGALLPRSVLVAGTGVALRAGLPEVIVAGSRTELSLELWGDDGEPVAAPEAVVTVVRPDGEVQGLAAPALGPGRFRFRATFARPGRHLLQVFVLDGDATVVIPFDVARARPTS